MKCAPLSFTVIFTTLLTSACATHVASRAPASEVTEDPLQIHKQCLLDLQLGLDHDNQLQHQSQLAINGGELGIYAGNFGKFYRGDSPTKAIILWHGFLASPQELRTTALALQAQGYNVLTPLIPGFGGSLKARNQSQVSAWKASVDKQIESLSRCFPQGISLGGFSLGGALVLDYVLNRNNALIRSIVLLAPYVSPALPLAKFTNQLAKKLSQSPPYSAANVAGTTLALPLVGVAKLLANQASDTFHQTEPDTVSFELLYEASKNRELQILMGHPEVYGTAMPLKAVDQILALADEMKSFRTPPAKSKISSLLIYTEADQTIDFKKSRDFAERNFEDPEIYVYDKNLGIAHQLVLPESGNSVDRMNAEIVRFLDLHN